MPAAADDAARRGRRGPPHVHRRPRSGKRTGLSADTDNLSQAVSTFDLMVSIVEPTPAVNDRGYRVPAEAPWGDDGPVLSQLDPSRLLVLIAFRGYAVCGYRLRRDEPVWRIVETYSRGTTFQDMQEGSSTFDDPPGHLICMLYSALVCPFWRTPGGRLGQDLVYEPGRSPWR